MALPASCNTRSDPTGGCSAPAVHPAGPIKTGGRLRRNGCPAFVGLGGRLQSESLAGFRRNAHPAAAASGPEIDRGVDATLQALYEEIPSASVLGETAAGILVFPNVVKAGFIIGGQYGEGALRLDGRTFGYYSTLAASYGLQAGAQSFGYALFFMTDDALDYLFRSSGWELGVGPSIVVLDEGAARTLTTTTAKSDIYAFIFSQRGLMAGLGLQGSKISRIDR